MIQCTNILSHAKIFLSIDPKLGVYFLVCTSPQTHVQDKSGERISPGRPDMSDHEVYTLNGLFVYCCSGHDDDVIRNGRIDDMGGHTQNFSELHNTVKHNLAISNNADENTLFLPRC